MAHKNGLKTIPEGFTTVTAYLVVKDAAKAIDFYARAFGATEVMRMACPTSKAVMHAEVKIGDSIIMISDENPHSAPRSPASLGGTTCALHLYVADADASVKRATSAGAQVKMPLSDMFWGARFGKVQDPFGHEWAISQRLEELTPAQLAERTEKFFAAGATK